MTAAPKPAAMNRSEKVVIQARIDKTLADTVADLSAQAGDSSTSDWLRRAVENEVSRQTLCMPAEKVSFETVMEKLGQMHRLAGAQSEQIRLQGELLRSVCQAVGVQVL